MTKKKELRRRSKQKGFLTKYWKYLAGLGTFLVVLLVVVYPKLTDPFRDAVVIECEQPGTLPIWDSGVRFRRYDFAGTMISFSRENSEVNPSIVDDYYGFEYVPRGLIEPLRGQLTEMRDNGEQYYALIIFVDIPRSGDSLLTQKEEEGTVTAACWEQVSEFYEQVTQAREFGQIHPDEPGQLVDGLGLLAVINEGNRTQWEESLGISIPVGIGWNGVDEPNINQLIFIDSLGRAGKLGPDAGIPGILDLVQQ